jgi:alkanesulfonate monooxygenase SsuD/methylene tetrahydromethanopterin reductase-like flavin-dependent oxidoreductase (luciferase family)
VVELCVAIAHEREESVDWSAWKAIAASCEANNVPGLYFADHYMTFPGAPDRPILDAWGVVCALAAVTSTLRIGTLVSPASFRHPSVLAKLAVTADHVSGGRIVLGMGAGWNEEEHARFGLPFHDLRTRMDVFEEQVQIVSGLLRPGPFSFAGTHYSYANVDAYPKPVNGRIPLMLGGEAGPRAARIAARWADEYNVIAVTPEGCRQCRAALEAAWRVAGRDLSSLRLSVAVWLLTGRDDDELLGRAGALAALIGQPDRDPAGFVAELRASSHWIVGTLDEAAEQLRALAAAGADLCQLVISLHRDLDQIALVGHELAARVRE